MASRVLVVGASGLIGQQILKEPRVRYVVSQSRVDRSLSPTHNAINVIAEALSNQCTSVLFLAWPSNSMRNYDQLNEYGIWVETCSELAILARDKDIHLFLVGSGSDKIPAVGNFYAKAKSDLRIRLALEIHKSQLTWFRPHYIFSLDPVRPRILQELLAQKEGAAEVHSPNTFNDYIHAEDVAKGMSMAIEKDFYGEVDIGSGFLTSNRSFVQEMSGVLNFKVPIFNENVEHRGDPASIDRLRSIGWKPSKTLEFLSGEKY